MTDRNDKWYRERILAITEQIVASRVLKGEVDPDDPNQLRAAAKDAAETARAAVNAALEFISG